MSSPSSVASSLSSFRSSASSHTSRGSHGGTREGSHEEDRYSDASFAAEDSSEPHQGTVDENEADDGYYDEDFEEDVDREEAEQPHGRECGGGRDEVEYSDDFNEPTGGNDDKPETSTATVERVVTVSIENPSASTCDRATQQPEDDLPRLVEAWARHKTELVWNRLKTGQHHETRVSETREHHLTNDVIASISERLKQRKHQVKNKSNQQHPRQRRSRTVAMPSSVVDRVRVQHLLALSARPSPPPHQRQGQRRQKDSISTFCVVKTADLSGKLATMRLEDLCAKWHVPDHDAHTTSRGVLEFIASTTYEQRRREVLRVARRDDCVLRAMRTQAVDLERTIQAAKDAVVDSKALMMEAQRILLAPDAHHCQCSVPSGNLDKVEVN